MDSKTCGNLLASMRMDRAGLDEALDGDLREVSMLCGWVTLYGRSDYYFPANEE